MPHLSPKITGLLLHSLFLKKEKSGGIKPGAFLPELMGLLIDLGWAAGCGSDCGSGWAWIQPAG